VASVTDFGGKLTYERTNAVAAQIAEMFVSGAADEIFVLYNSFISMMIYRPTLEQMLPLDPDALLAKAAESVQAGATGDYIMEPSGEAVFSSLLPRYLN